MSHDLIVLRCDTPLIRVEKFQAWLWLRMSQDRHIRRSAGGSVSRQETLCTG